MSGNFLPQRTSVLLKILNIYSPAVLYVCLYLCVWFIASCVSSGYRYMCGVMCGKSGSTVVVSLDIVVDCCTTVLYIYTVFICGHCYEYVFCKVL